ncbi:MAG: hypothetical protein HY911_00910 [Desulfobacterales bacterium]|nr:hypothetical protein [Desulfobacterales bacterium]
MAQTVSQQVELGQLLANTIGAVVQAQERLDTYSLARREAYEEAPAGSLALPPLWYVFNKVDVQMELSATVEPWPLPGDAQSSGPHLFCRTLEPTMVSLYGYQASAGLSVRVQMTPQGAMPIKADPKPTDSPR